MKLKHLVIGIVLAAAFGNSASAKVSEAEAARLGKDLTPLGAEVAGNKDGSIPAWTGSMNGLPAGLKWQGDGHFLPDPYANEKPLFVITAQNAEQYRHRLTEGQLALLKKYPDSFRIPVYPTHRDGRYYKAFEERTAYNATRAYLANGVEGIQGYTGSIPFPLPQNGGEVIANTRMASPFGVQNGITDDIGVFANGQKAKRRQRQFADMVFNRRDIVPGTPQPEIGEVAAYLLIEVLEPSRDKGRLTLIYEPLDYVTNSRKAWIYLPGARRVRQAPTVGYDTPDGPGGMLTVDDTLGFNGGMDRYEWTLVGKQELYIPYHSYKFDDPNVSYDKLLLVGHSNPDYMRYELHRVWVVEANLKKTARHIYSKRRFYVDEDSWNIVGTDAYDGHGELWRTSLINSVYHFGAQGYINRTLQFHDLNAGNYVAIRVVNELDGPFRLLDEPKGVNYFKAENLRKMGTR